MRAESSRPFGGAELPRLRVVPVILFSAVLVVCFSVALVSPGMLTWNGETDAVMVLAAPMMLLLAAPGVASGAFLLLFSRPAVVAILIPVTGAVSFAISRDWVTACFAMLLFAPVFLLRRLLAGGMGRTAAICRLSACCGVVALPAIYTALARAYRVAAPGALLDAVLADCTALFSSLQVQTEGEAQVLFGEEQSALIVQLLLVLLPGLTLLFCNAMAWLSHGLALLLFRIHGLGRLITPPMRVLTLSRAGAVVFLIGCAGSVLFGTGDTIGFAEAVSLNLVILLEPPFVLLGAAALAAFYRTRESINGFTLALMMLAMLTCNLSVLLLIIACIGVWRAVRRQK